MIELNDYDVVLGTKWLKTLGAVTWDFVEMTTSFKINEKTVAVYGLKVPDTSLISGKQFNRLLSADSIAIAL